MSGIGATSTRESSGKRRSSHRKRVCCFGVDDEPLDDGAGVALADGLLDADEDAAADGAGVVAASRATPRVAVAAAGVALGLGVAAVLGDGEGVGDAVGEGAGDDCAHGWPDAGAVSLALAMKKSAIEVAVATLLECVLRSSAAT